MLRYVGFAFTLVLYFGIINCKLWKNGMVHYVINKEDFDGHSQNLIVSALTGIEREVCLRFLGSTLNQRAGDAMLLHIANPTKRQDCPTQQYVFDKSVIEMSIGFKCLNDKDISRIVLDMLKASVLQTAQTNGTQISSANTAQDGKLYSASDRSYVNSAYRAECLGAVDAPSGRRTMGREQAAETEKYFAKKIWPLGIVMYGLGSGLHGTEVDKKIRAAMSTIEAASCVTFQPIATDNAMHTTNFLWLSEYSDEYPAQGFVSGNQTVSIHALAHGAPGHSAHTLYMLLRVLGAPMMSNRYDRDKYVTINWGHVDKPRAHMLEKEPKEAWFWGSGLDTYEYKSATHAPVNFMCTDCTLGEQTVQPIQDPFWTRSFAMGHREDLSPSDIKMLQLLYGAQCAQRHRTADVQDDANDQTTHKTDYQYEVYLDVGPQSNVTGTSNTKGGKKDLSKKNDHVTLKMVVQEIPNGPAAKPEGDDKVRLQNFDPPNTDDLVEVKKKKLKLKQESGTTMVVSRLEVLPAALTKKKLKLKIRPKDRMTLQLSVPQDDHLMKKHQKSLQLHISQDEKMTKHKKKWTSEVSKDSGIKEIDIKEIDKKESAIKVIEKKVTGIKESNSDSSSSIEESRKKKISKKQRGKKATGIKDCSSYSSSSSEESREKEISKKKRGKKGTSFNIDGNSLLQIIGLLTNRVELEIKIVPKIIINQNDNTPKKVTKRPKKDKHKNKNSKTTTPTDWNPSHDEFETPTQPSDSRICDETSSKKPADWPVIYEGELSENILKVTTDNIKKYIWFKLEKIFKSVQNDKQNLEKADVTKGKRGKDKHMFVIDGTKVTIDDQGQASLIYSDKIIRFKTGGNYLESIKKVMQLVMSYLPHTK